jgi:Arc/MetJ-type ribon-helix-helix transcriptional regulator
MTITLTPGQEKAIQDAIRAGLVRSVDEFIASAIQAIPRREGEFDVEKARRAAGRIRDLRKGVHLDRHGMSIRELAHLGHKY